MTIKIEINKEEESGYLEDFQEISYDMKLIIKKYPEDSQILKLREDMSNLFTKLFSLLTREG